MHIQKPAPLSELERANWRAAGIVLAGTLAFVYVLAFIVGS